MTKAIRKDTFNVGSEAGYSGLYVAIKSTSKNRRPNLLPLLAVSPRDSENPLDHTLSSFAVSLSPVDLDVITDGDIVRLSDNGFLRVALGRHANANSLLVTERCDNACVFCSQPPRDVDDDLLLSEAALALIEFASDSVVGITGGEPLLYGKKFSNFLATLNENACPTPLHILTNGRALKDKAFTRDICKAIANRDVTFGIPLYGSTENMHDSLVQMTGAWRETVEGLINASAFGIKVELRIIPTKANMQQIESICEMAIRCFGCVEQVSIMNLEPKGWARKNWDQVYIAPECISHELQAAVRRCENARVTVRLFNYPLCLLDESLRDFAVPSISDWKNYFPEECKPCSSKSYCCGFFTSATGHFIPQVRPIHENAIQKT